jgi:hypothetical protein
MTASEMKTQQIQQVTHSLQRDISLVKDRLTGNAMMQFLEPMVRKFVNERDEIEQGKLLK